MAQPQISRRAAAAQSGEINCTPEEHEFTLVIAQNPQRARMCGFGDRDRRPLTPPLIVKLLIRDRATGAYVDPDAVNMTFFVLSADLWTADRSSEANLVVHPSVAIPAQRRQSTVQQAIIGENTVTAMAPLIDSSLSAYPLGSQSSPYPTQSPSSGAPLRLPSLRNLGDGSAAPVSPSQPTYLPTSTSMPTYGQPQPLSIAQRDPHDAMAIRNLVGALQSSAHKMRDLNNELGLYFAFVDLSIRTEGNFRLHLSLTDLSNQHGLEQPKAPILAETYTDVFEVLTAKRFPGMLEPTPLSQCFARQGLRIPTRQSRRIEGGPGGVGGAASEEGDDDEIFEDS